jgi:hypothetical protein
MYFNVIISWLVDSVFVLCGQHPSVYGRCPAPEVKSGQGKNSPPTHIPGSYLHLCMPLLSSISVYLYSGLYSIPFVFSVIGVDRGRLAIWVAWISKQLTWTPSFVFILSLVTEYCVSQVLLQDQFLYRKVNARTDTQFKAVNSVYFISSLIQDMSHSWYNCHINKRIRVQLSVATSMLC